MSEVAVPDSLTIPAAPKQMRVARAFVAGVFGVLGRTLTRRCCWPGAGDQQGPAVSVGLVTATVIANGHGVGVEVTDRSGNGLPVLNLPMAARQRQGDAVSGRARRRVGVSAGAD
jgi:hypothetical protein